MTSRRAQETAEVRLLRAALLDDRRKRERIIARELAGRWFTVLTPAALSLAARHAFEGWDRRVMAAFARRFVAKAPGAEDFLPRDAEAVLRTVTGDVHLLPGTAGHERLPDLCFALLLAVADDLAMTAAEVDDLLTEAQRESVKVAEMIGEPLDLEGDPSRLRRFRRTHRQFLTDADVAPAPATPQREPRPLTAGRRVEPATRAGWWLRSWLVDGDAPDGDVSKADQFLIVRATLSEALWRYLPDEPDLREITALVRAAAPRSPDLHDPMKAEYVIRLIMGEQVSLDGFVKRDIFVAGGVLLQVIAEASGRDEAAVRDVIVAGEEALARSGRELAT